LHQRLARRRPAVEIADKDELLSHRAPFAGRAHGGARAGAYSPAAQGEVLSEWNG
jgi:hypothetical protein